jgi:hypothetical protein
MLPVALLGVMDVWVAVMGHEGWWQDVDFLWPVVVWVVMHAAVMVGALVRTLVMLKRATHCGGTGLAAAGAGIMVGVPVLFAGSLAVVDYLLGLLALMARSLWG